jgi:tRNA A-37 threonylcarbamoyl transferase component Bud32/tetratricopeptide (TPR) repeat protein
MLPRTVRELFDAALLLPPEARAAWLAVQSLAPETAARVAALLAAEQIDASILDRPFAQHLHASSATDEARLGLNLLTTHIEGYRLLHLLGRGGMASVFAAERLDADFKQQVAIKLLRRTLHSELELRLFQRERQTLASLEHPNIARLLDGGVTAAGVPYLVMELVIGTDLLSYARETALSLRARLQLFAQVCDAVNAAHRALIVHRDIKPANVFVNQQGVVKLLDFGIAKMLDEPGSPATTYAPLTPEYAAPEQFDGRAITTATDVYGLGILLHELLLGVRPSRGDSLRASDRVTTLDPYSPPTETITRSELKRFLRGDIDNILRQALDPQPSERYASAGDFASDLRRFLDGLPVQAHPPSAWYRCVKFVRRHSAAVALFSILLLALMSSVVIALTQARRADQMAIDANQRALEAQAQTRAAQAALGESGAVQAFLYDIIRAANPNRALDAPDTLRDVLEQAQARLETDLGGQPAVQIELYGFLRQIREQFGDNVQAIALGQTQVELALEHYGANHAKTAAAQFQLARLLLFAGDDAGFTMLQSAVERLAELAPDGLDRAYALVAFASAQSQRGRIDDALGSLNTAATLLHALCAGGEERACQEQVAALSHLGIARYQNRDYAAAAAAFSEGAGRAEQLYGPNHSMTLRLLGNLATCQVQIDPNAAISTMQRVMRLTAQLPVVAIDTVPAQHNGLGLALSRIGQNAEAREQFQAALDHIDASQRNGPQRKIFTLNLISEQIALGDAAGARRNLQALQSILQPTEDNYIHLARSDEYAAWLEVLGGRPAAGSYRLVDSALRWRNREANPRLPDILKTLALGVRIAARHGDASQAAKYQVQIEHVRDQVPTLPDSVAQELLQARFELAIAMGDVATAVATLREYAKVVGGFRPNAAFEHLQSMRLALAKSAAGSPAPTPR